MSGTYPGHGPGERPEYGGRRSRDEYADDGGYPDRGGHGGYGDRSGYGEPNDHRGGYGDRGYGDRTGHSDYEPAPSRYGPPIPAQGYPGHDDGYGGYDRYQEPPPAYPGYSGTDPHRDYRDQRGGPPPHVGGPPTSSSNEELRRTPKKRRRGLVVLVVALVLLGVCGVGGYVAAKPYLAEWPATLAKPDKVAGLEISTEPALQQAADEISAGIREDVKVDAAIAAFYHDPTAPEKIVALVGGTAFLISPKAELDEAFNGARGDGMTMGEVKDVDPGSFGGLMRCGAGEQAAEGGRKVPLSVCAWADHGSLVIGLFFNRAADESADLLRTIRSEMLTR